MLLFTACMICIAGSTSVLPVENTMATATYAGNVHWTNVPGRHGNCTVSLYGPNNEYLGSDTVFEPGEEYEISYSFAGNPPDNCYLRAFLIVPSLPFQYRWEYDIDYPEDYSGYTHYHTFDFDNAGIGFDGTSGAEEFSLIESTFASIKSSLGQ